MSEDNNRFDPFDPTGMFKSLRNEQMDTWAKFMVQFVNNEAYADATGKMLDAWLSNSGPFRKLIENTMQQALANLSMPSREEVTRLAGRLTNIEMRLDDLDAKLDQLLQATRAAAM
jgi:hypothetical protein